MSSAVCQLLATGLAGALLVADALRKQPKNGQAMHIRKP